ncbi:putative glycosyltransferase [Shimwellia blattae DSM 4481 = NBRC 105725]|uniref:Putative glycosyltransferase n=2 Tax=Shimwellia blattae TaxID=563 RepID=I2B7Q3_SHIBC|nr:glycosyltransferase family 2 protein [Shimwellia blattae]AFJ46557.1 putative glycosyltransferase [Shimwellia blattae DSM 4481 = NBRC 105725]GAB80136.1 hypothetical protein EB105725_04_02470 [Shimwellia blattae DSM 4481 = NBRC 105725]VDY64025.1 Poly-beta-1,6-N-acetyl-D-glucosamine synthase [Shimwellia blattae]VEC22160.1 Poly-beta-1,6-N-acetyl-D-glucosamine synthase [Shimwellia blattae]
MASQEVKLSIIIPAYNASKSIGRTLLSFSSAITCSYEVIIVDDCSTDNTVEVISNYAELHQNIHVISLPVNSGPGVARDEGLKHAIGEYILFFDSDDLMRRNAVDRTIAFLDKNNIDVAVLRYAIMFGKEKKDIGMWERDSQIYMEVQNKFGLIFEPAKFPYFLTVTNYPWTKICRADFLRSNNIEFGRLRLHEDILPHWMILMNAKKIYVSTDVICDYIFDPDGGNITNNKSALRLQCVDAANVLYSTLQSKPIYKPYLFEFWKFAACLLDWAKDVIDTSYKQQLLSSIQNIFLKISFEELQRIYHTDKDTYSVIYKFILNKGF